MLVILTVCQKQSFHSQESDPTILSQYILYRLVGINPYRRLLMIYF